MLTHMAWNWVRKTGSFRMSDLCRSASVEKVMKKRVYGLPGTAKDPACTHRRTTKDSPHARSGEPTKPLVLCTVQKLEATPGTTIPRLPPKKSRRQSGSLVFYGKFLQTLLEHGHLASHELQLGLVDMVAQHLEGLLHTQEARPGRDMVCPAHLYVQHIQGPATSQPTLAACVRCRPWMPGLRRMDKEALQAWSVPGPRASRDSPMTCKLG